MKKNKRRWSWTSKNLRKTRSKDQRYNDININFKIKSRKRYWRINRKYLKKQTKIVSDLTRFDLFIFESNPFYGEHWLKYLPNENFEILMRNSELDWYDFRTQYENCLNFPKEVYYYDFTGYLSDVTSFLKCGDAIDLGLKIHKKYNGSWDHPYW